MSLTQDLRWSLGRSIALQLQRQTDLILCTINCFLQWDHLPNMAVGDLAFYYTLCLWRYPVLGLGDIQYYAFFLFLYFLQQVTLRQEGLSNQYKAQRAATRENCPDVVFGLPWAISNSRPGRYPILVFFYFPRQATLRQEGLINQYKAQRTAARQMQPDKPSPVLSTSSADNGRAMVQKGEHCIEIASTSPGGSYRRLLENVPIWV